MTFRADRTCKTTCPYCGVGCGVLATPKSDGSVDIKGDPDHPANFGRLCSKGSALGETISLEGRLLHPEIAGEQTSWDEALDLVAQKFSDTIAEHGPDSVAFYVSGQILTEDYYVANKLMKGYMGSANIDTNSRLCMASSVAGHRKAFGTDTVPGTYEDLELADLIVLVGSNLAWCHPVLYQRIEAAKQARPEMKIVLIDPRRTMTANIADLHLPISPDGDTALFTGLLTYLSQRGVLDADYIEQHTNGFEEALHCAAETSLETVADLTGLSPEQIKEFYRLFCDTEKTVTVYSQGVNQSVCGTDKVSSILNCHLATGRIGKPGTGPFSVTGQPNAMGGREVGGLANMLACHMDLENEDHRDLVQGFWGSPQMPAEHGYKAVELFKAVGDGRIKAIWIMSTNPVDSLPEADTVAAALEACPFVVVSDILKDTDTIQYADVKLPAAAWGEKSGTVTNSERRISRQRQFMALPGEVRPDWWQMAEVGKRMGFADAFDYASPAAVFEEYAKLSALANEDDRDFNIGALADIAFEDYDQLEPVQWPVVGEIERKEKRFFSKGNFYTPDRKARFIPISPKAVSVTSAQHPFVLNTGRIRDQWHTMTRTARSQRLSSHYGEPFCEINPNDARKLGIEPASLVKISNGHGQIVVRALIVDRVRSGEVFVPMHWTDQFASNGRVDKLVPNVIDPFSAQPASKNVAVAVSPLKVGAFGYLVSREKPDLRGLTLPYWALSKCESGWRAEVSFETESDQEHLLDMLAQASNAIDRLEYVDAASGQKRRVGFDGEQCTFALFTSSEPVALSREWLDQCLVTPFPSTVEKLRVLAGRASAAMPSKGAIVCSCMNVGINEIRNAICDGALTAERVGRVTTAGTNCGSCRAEITGLINETLDEAKIAAQ